ncbi:MAG TPA: tetratricopeptide repeat protein [Rariglobus sp.]
MKRLSLILACAVLWVATGCSPKKKEVPEAVKAEAGMYYSEAEFAMQIREFARAEELIQRAIKLNDDVPEYWVRLGMVRRKQENKDGARKAYKQALELHSAHYKKTKEPKELAQQAFVLALLGRTDEALKLLEKGLKDHPDSPEMKKLADPRGFPRTFQNPQFKELTV